MDAASFGLGAEKKEMQRTAAHALDRLLKQLVHSYGQRCARGLLEVLGVEERYLGNEKIDELYGRLATANDVS